MTGETNPWGNPGVLLYLMHMTAYLPAFTVFLGSFLLFGVQPMLGRTLLPSFGGTAAVWTVCLAAYQTLLLVGYFYAHVIAKQPRRTQTRLHTGLLALAIMWTTTFAYFRPEIKAQIGNSALPALEVLFCVLLFVGLPYVMLSAGSTLVQTWLAGSDRPDPSDPSDKHDGRGVYRLYAVSNLGSFCGLLIYPFLLDPYVSLNAQWWSFAVCLAAYTALLAVVAKKTVLRSLSAPVSCVRLPGADGPPSSFSWFWFTLPCLSVFLLNAVTAHLSLDVMALPLLWVFLLGAFLTSYILGFGRHSARWLRWSEPLGAVCLVVLSFTMKQTGGMGILIPNLVCGFGLILFGCTYLHAWLYGLRPDGRELTRYYLYNALGGAIGGVLASLVAPVVFKSVTEYPLALFLFLILAVCRAWGVGVPKTAVAEIRVFPRGLYMPLAALAAGMVAYHTYFENTKGRTVVYRDRGFFGTVLVSEIPAVTQSGQGALREFIHGSVVHGLQVQIPGKFRMPTAYFTPDSGGLAITQHPKYKRGDPLRVGVLGLGIGVLVAYSRTNDYYRCYEISQEALYCAKNHFTFLKDSPAKVDLVIGDARKAMEKERAENEEPFDVLYVDAFTGDNLPAHLSTREAFRLYFDRLKPDGILAVNISNWHMNLFPLVRSVTDTFTEVQAAVVTQDKRLEGMRFPSAWAFMMRGDSPAGFIFPPDAKMINLDAFGGFKLPSDEKGSFVSLINF